MKYLFLFAFLSEAFAWSLSIRLPCKDKDLTSNFSLSDQSVGKLTLELLNAEGISYEGAESHMSSIDESPQGLDAIIVVSDSAMRAYGWCFTVGGEVPPVYGHQVIIDDPEEEVVWFYGYANYENGNWTSMCSKPLKKDLEVLCNRSN